MTAQDPRWSAETYELVARDLTEKFAQGHRHGGMWVVFRASDGHNSIRGASADEVTEAVLTALADAGLLPPPGKPQGDEQPAPRVWAMPEIPADVVAVRDGEGFVWRRLLDVVGGVWRRSTGAWTGDIVRSMMLRPELGPLTEVDGSQT